MITVKKRAKSLKYSKIMKPILLIFLCINVAILLVPLLDVQDVPSQELKIDTEVRVNDWNADEDQFLRGLNDKKPEKYYIPFNEMSLPTASYGDPTTIPDVIHVLVILVQYSDLSGTLSKSTVESRIFGSSNSMNDYYNEITFGKTTIVGNATNWLTLPNTRAFYGKDSVQYHDDYYQTKFKTMTDIIDLANPYVDYGLYNKVMIVHAGHGQEESGNTDDIWSSAYSPASGVIWTRDGAPIYTASLTPELGSSGQSAIGVYAHEFGHQCNLPDLYDTVGSNNYVDGWCLMDYGSWNGATLGSSPAHPIGWCKNFLGLIPENKMQTVLDTQCIIVTLDDLETGGSNYLLAKIPLQDSDHYYLVEARFLTGYDSYLPGEGIIITKVDNTQSSGHGIVTVMDSRAGTATKNDGEYDYESVETEYGIFHDNVNNIHIIIKSQTTTSFTIMIDRKETWQMTRYTIGANSITTFDLGNFFNQHQRIAWHWIDVAGGSDNIDSWLERYGGSTYEQVDDYSHDSGVFQVEAIGYYSIKIRNQNILFSTSYDFCWRAYDAYDLRIISAEISKDPLYVTNNFTVTATIQNWGDATPTSASIRLSKQSYVGFQSGEIAEKYATNLAQGETFTATWNLTALTQRINTLITMNAQSDASPYDNYIYNQIIEIDILVDSIAPQLSILSPYMDDLFNASTVLLRWDSYDYQSGIKEFKIYMNETYFMTLPASTTEYWAPVFISGKFTFKVQVIDNADNDANDSVTIFNDVEIPNIFSAVCNTDWIRSSGSCIFTVSASDVISGLYKAKVYQDMGSGIWSLLDWHYFTSGTLNLECNIGVLSGSEVDFKIVVEDNAGNTNESLPITLNIDNNLPSVNILSINFGSGNSEAHMGILNLSIVASDSTSNIASVHVSLTNDSDTINGFAIYNDTTGFYEYFYDTSNTIFNQEVHVEVTVYDLAGNMNEDSEDIILNIDNDLPMVNIFSIISGSGNREVHAGILNISIVASDSTSNIAFVHISLTNDSDTINGFAIYNDTTGFYEFFYDTSNTIFNQEVHIEVTVYDLAGNMNEDSEDIFVSNVTPSPNLLPFILIVGGVAVASVVGIVVVKKSKESKLSKQKREITQYILKDNENFFNFSDKAEQGVTSNDINSILNTEDVPSDLRDLSTDKTDSLDFKDFSTNKEESSNLKPKDKNVKKDDDFFEF
jgi:M6 family metalloprotease-like protein